MSPSSGMLASQRPFQFHPASYLALISSFFFRSSSDDRGRVFRAGKGTRGASEPNVIARSRCVALMVLLRSRSKAIGHSDESVSLKDPRLCIHVELTPITHQKASTHSTDPSHQASWTKNHVVVVNPLSTPSWIHLLSIASVGLHSFPSAPFCLDQLPHIPFPSSCAAWRPSRAYLPFLVRGPRPWR